MLICELEHLASTYALVALEDWLPADVWSFTDNTVAQSAMRRLSPSTQRMQRIESRRSKWMLDRGIVEEVRRITSKANLWADIGSRPERGGWEEVARQARRLGFEAVRVPLPEGWGAEGLLDDTDACWAC